MIENRNEIIINASRDAIWKALTDIEHYPEWNPLLYEGKGTVKLGNKVEVSSKTPSHDIHFECEVTKFYPPNELVWKFHVGPSFIFRGEHRFKLEPLTENQTRLIDIEQFRGLMTPLQAKDLKTNGHDGMEAMDKALKKRAESVAG